MRSTTSRAELITVPCRLSFARTAWPVAASLAIALGVYVVGVGPIAALGAAIAVSWFAYRFRVWTTAALAISILIPQLMLMTTVLPENWGSLGGGVRISDLILVGMWGAIIGLGFSSDHRHKVQRTFVSICFVLAVLLLVAIVRNWSVYGLSALGEFRFRYLILGFPVYLALGMDSPRSRTSVSRMMAWLPILGVVIALPIVGMSNGWAVGEASRFYPSEISIALLYSVVWLGLTRGGGAVPQRGLMYAAFLLAAVFIVADSHRSVWLVAAVSVLLLLRLGVIRVERIWSWGLVTLIGAAAIFAVLGVTGTDVVAYVAKRGSAFMNPIGDSSSYWRLVVWKAYIDPWLSNPMFGQGFGGYWDVYVPELGTRIVAFPHSMYIQTLVKLGVVGMAALLAWFAAAWRVLLRAYRGPTAAAGILRSLAPMGLVAVAGSLAYGTVYALEFWSLGWIGLALSEAFRSVQEPVLTGAVDTSDAGSR